MGDSTRIISSNIIKLCMLDDSSTYSTRLKSYLNKNASDIKIFTQDLVSISKIFGDHKVKETLIGKSKIKILVNSEANIKQSFIEEFKEDYNVEIKQIDNLKFNLFIKTKSDSVDFELYPFGYNPQKTKHSGDYGFCLKIKSRLLQTALDEYFDEVWEKETLVPFKDVLLVTKPGQRASCCGVDNGGKLFKNVNLRITTNDGLDSKMVGSIDYGDRVRSYFGNYFLNNYNSKLLVAEDKVILTTETKGNMNIVFYDNIVCDELKKSLTIEPQPRNRKLKNVADIINNDDIKSEHLYAYLITFWGDQGKIEEMRNHYIATKQNGKEKFETTYNSVEKLINNKSEESYISPYDIFICREKIITINNIQ